MSHRLCVAVPIWETSVGWTTSPGLEHRLSGYGPSITVSLSPIGRLLMSGVITLIKDDHKKLESVFKKLESAEPADTPPLLQQVAELLIPHSRPRNKWSQGYPSEPTSFRQGVSRQGRLARGRSKLGG